MHLSDIREQLTKNGYLPSNEIVMAAYGALHGVPLLVESDPGQGKTSLAMAMGKLSSCLSFVSSFMKA